MALRPSRRLLVDLLVGLMLFEVTLRVAMSRRFLLDAMGRLGETGLRYAAMARFDRARPEGELWGVASAPLRADPDLGWGLVPGTHLLQDGMTATVHAGGYRGAAPPGPKVPGVLRVAALGDSFTFGDEVGDDEVWTAVADRRLPDAEVLSFGVNGYGHDQMLLAWRRDVAPLHPDVVVLAFLAVDVPRNVRSFQAWQKPRFELDGAGLVLTGQPVPGTETLLAAHRWRPRTVDAVRMLWEASHREDPDAEAERDALTVALLRTLDAEVTASGARLLVVYGPQDGEWRSGVPAPEWHLLQGACTAVPLVCADALPRFQAAHAERVRLVRRAHWSPEGQAVFAEEVVQALQDRGWAAPGLTPRTSGP